MRLKIRWILNDRNQILNRIIFLTLLGWYVTKSRLSFSLPNKWDIVTRDDWIDGWIDVSFDEEKHSSFRPDQWTDIWIISNAQTSMEYNFLFQFILIGILFCLIWPIHCHSTGLVGSFNHWFFFNQSFWRLKVVKVLLQFI